MSGLVLFAKDVERVAAFYRAVLDARELERHDTHVVLEHAGDELVVHGMPASVAAGIAIADPPAPRRGAAMKPAFDVLDIDRVRAAAAAHGGMLYPERRGFEIRGRQVIDGLDPEGNVVQFRFPLAAG